MIPVMSFDDWFEKQRETVLWAYARLKNDEDAFTMTWKEVEQLYYDSGDGKEYAKDLYSQHVKQGKVSPP